MNSFAKRVYHALAIRDHRTNVVDAVTSAGWPSWLLDLLPFHHSVDLWKFLVDAFDIDVEQLVDARHYNNDAWIIGSGVVPHSAYSVRHYGGMFTSGGVLAPLASNTQVVIRRRYRQKSVFYQCASSAPDPRMSLLKFVDRAFKKQVRLRRALAKRLEELSL